MGILLKRLHQSEVTPATREQLQDHRKMLLEVFIQNPGNFGYCHGDASIFNFTLLNDEVFMIDFNGIDKMRIYGIPAYEYYRFLSSIMWKMKDPAGVQQISQRSKDGYGETGFTQEAEVLFQQYWFNKY